MSPVENKARWQREIVRKNIRKKRDERIIRCLQKEEKTGSALNLASWKGELGLHIDISSIGRIRAKTAA